MENSIWAEKYQQSVPTTDIDNSTENSLNNGSTENGEEEDSTNTKKTDTGFVEKDSTPITISEKAKQIIHSILEQIKPLSQIEKFLLFLKLPSEVTSAVDPFRQPLNPLGSRSEITRTISWIKTHLEEDPDISLPKQEVYNEYHNYCGNNSIKPLSQADFGKVMKQVYPRVRARRLGTRGNSRYCYSGLRRCAKLEEPILPDLADKPMSTEAPFTQSSLASAAWVIVKEWSEQQLNQQFPTIQALAYFLILNYSIGSGSEAASKIVYVGESSIKEEGSGKVPNKHREMQLQLQRKIQQKNEGKERKKRTQSPKSEPKPPLKKSRSQSVPARDVTCNYSPVTAATSNGNSMGAECGTGMGCGGNSSTATSSTCGSTSTSPTTQAKPICDKSVDFTQLPVLPDFNSFQKPAAAAAAEAAIAPTTIQEAQMVVTTNNKIRISRLPPSSVAHENNNSDSGAPPRKQQIKYKSLRPRLQQCDILAPYEPQTQPQPRSRLQPPPPLPAVARTPTTATAAEAGIEDARSQHLHDIIRIKERISDDDDDDDDDECDDVPDFPLTRERLNSVSNVSKDAMDEYLGTNNSQHEEELSKYFNNNLPETADPEDTTKLSTLRQLLVQNITDAKPPLPTIFDNKQIPFHQLPIHNYLPPVSIKRRVSFETPEDSVPPSPNTRRKNFSFTPISPGPSPAASPFVSPRNTPIPRSKINTGILKSEVRKLKVKREIDLTVEIPNEILPMSAPASPMLNNKSVLQKLLNSTGKVAYNPSYTSVRSLPQQTEFFSSNLEVYRSRSVPLHTMVTPITPIDEVFNPNEFSEIDPIPESDNENVKQILNSLDDLTSTNVNIREFGLQLYTDYAHDVGVPSKSVPSTPVVGQKINFGNSRSYPSTPLNSAGSFTYANVNGDCLLNGQPVLDGLDLNFGGGGQTPAGSLNHDNKDFGIGAEFDMVQDDESQLINSGLIETNFIGNIVE